MARHGTLLVADEIYYNLYGKAILQGVYHGDLTIAVDPSPTPQLIFYFMVETDVSEPFHSLTAEVLLPGSPPVRNFVQVIPPEFFKTNSSGRTRVFYKHPMLVPAPVLKPGKIEAKIIHEGGEIEVGAPWIVLNVPQGSPT